MTIKKPTAKQIQTLIKSHPDGEPGKPLAVGFPEDGRIIIIDCIGHKLKFSPDQVKKLISPKPQPKPSTTDKAKGK